MEAVSVEQVFDALIARARRVARYRRDRMTIPTAHEGSRRCLTTSSPCFISSRRRRGRGRWPRPSSSSSGSRRGATRSRSPCTPGSILCERAEAAGVDVVGMEMRSELNPVTIAKLAHMVRTRRAQIVHAHRAHAHSLGLLAAAVTGRPFVVSRRVSFKPKDNAGSRLKYTSGRVARIVAVSAGREGCARRVRRPRGSA